MGYRFRHDDDSVEAGVRRIATEQLTKAIASLDDDGALHEGVHDARKRIKKLRALLRLIKPGFKRQASENATLRDAAQTLSGLRDHAAMLETLDRLAARHEDRIGTAHVAAVRDALEARRDAAGDAADLTERIEAFRNVLREARDRVETWRLKGAEWEALGPGLARSYAGGQTAMRAAHKAGHAEDFHDFRKRVKDHGYHARLLAPIWPPLMDPYAALLDDLGERLGEQHDLVEFTAVLADAEVKGKVRTAFRDIVAEERQALEARALVVGARVYAETPKAVARRLGAWWAAWRADPSAVDQDDANDPPSAASISAMVSAIP